MEFPLHKGLIVSTDREEVVLSEKDLGDVLGVTTVRSGLSLDAGIVEEVDEAIVVTCSE